MKEPWPSPNFSAQVPWTELLSIIASCNYGTLWFPQYPSITVLLHRPYICICITRLLEWQVRFLYVYMFIFQYSSIQIIFTSFFSVSLDVYSLVGQWHNSLKMSGHCRRGRRGGWLWGFHCLLMPSRCSSLSYFGQRTEWGVWWERKGRRPRHDQTNHIPGV